MVEASMNGFLKFIIILCAIYMAFRLIFKLFGQRILQYVFRRILNKSEQRFRTSNFNRNTARTGETTVLRDKKKSKNSDKGVGEYIDFEEID